MTGGLAIVLWEQTWYKGRFHEFWFDGIASCSSSRALQFAQSYSYWAPRCADCRREPAEHTHR